MISYSYTLSSRITEFLMLIVAYAYHNNAYKLSAYKDNSLYLFLKFTTTQYVFLDPQVLGKSTKQFNGPAKVSIDGFLNDLLNY